MAASRDVFEEILIQSRITNRLLAAQLRHVMKQHELIELLSTTGASPRDIADVVNTTPGTVNATLARLRKKVDKE